MAALFRSLGSIVDSGKALTSPRTQGDVSVLFHPHPLRVPGDTGTEVRIAVQGPPAYRVLGITHQSALFTTIREALRLP
ncbi:hypothetical protein [Streptomyces sp. MAI_2237]